MPTEQKEDSVFTQMLTHLGAQDPLPDVTVEMDENEVVYLRHKDGTIMAMMSKRAFCNLIELEQ